MITDLNTSGTDALSDYDLCIVGSGPAGMTLAAELADSGLRLCVLESGRARPTKHGDALRRVVSEGITIKDYSRERVLGGASTTWAGLSSPLDAADMEPRPFLRHSGWPITRDELLPYWADAAERYRFAPLELFGPDGFGALRDRNEVALDWNEVEEKVFLAASEPQDFGREHRHVFERDGIDLLLDATVLRLETDESGGYATRAVLATSTGRELSCRARVFVLATGGIENARLLLASRLGNEHDQVGRYLMNHPKNYHGVIRLTRPVKEMPYHFGCLHKGYAGYAGLRVRLDTQAGQGLLNHYVRFEPLFPWSGNLGVEAFVFLVKRSRGLLRGWKSRREDTVVPMRDYSETGDDSDLQNERKGVLDWFKLLGLVVINLPRVLQYVVSRLREGSSPTIHKVRLRNFMEMEPDPENRVLLGDAQDANGQAVPVVRHQVSERDRNSLLALHAALSADLAVNGFGTLESGLAEASPWPIDLDASHHMGTTRMGTDPAESVVDTRLRLHSVDNVYVAGASVFPTSGCANPTFTLVALSIRLARHLRERVFGDGAR
ncbi:MAG: FAD-dependent oxidoreductase [Planctomycetota bacterium]